LPARIVSYARAADGRISGVTTKQNATAAVVSLASGIAYQPLSRIVQQMAYGNGLNDFNSFTGDGEIDVLGTYMSLARLRQDGATSIINRAHTRTDNQNLTNIFDNVTPANNATFFNEPGNKLQNANGPWGAKTFYWDGVGNRTQEITTVGATTDTDVYGYPATSNRLVQITRGAATVAAMVYDNGGNLLSDTRAGSAKTYTYNNRNRLATATVGALNYSYVYNGREQLSIRQQTTPAATTHFVHDLSGNVIAETSGTAAGTTREYIWLPETEIAPTREAVAQVDRPLAVVNAVGTTGVAVWNVSVDHLNRPVLLTNSSKAAQWTAVWQPWGGIHAMSGTAALDARLPGQWFQSETGLHYNWHRSYDPTVGRYTQPDPLGFVDGPSVYGYAKGRPQTLVDKDGRSTATDTLPGVAVPAIALWCLATPANMAICTAAGVGLGVGAAITYCVAMSIPKKKAGTAFPPQPNSGCTCECMTAMRDTSAWGVYSATAVGPPSQPTCQAAYTEACSAGRSGVNGKDPHHHSGKCTDSRGRSYLGKGGSVSGF
jgi:RHS repeat-associated protein